MMKQEFDANKPMQIGGQAVIEGVMMRAPGMVATAVRRSNGEIHVLKNPYQSLAERNSMFTWPILRGAAGLVEMMVIGIRTLNYSAEIAMHDAEAGEQAAGNGSPPAPRTQRSNLALAFTVGIALLIGVAVFFVTPLLVTTFFFSVDQDPLVFNLIAGGIRIAILLGYLAAISTLRDVHRLFQYHGAEHKAVFAFELGAGLEVTAAGRQTRFHPRCGTSFLLIVMFTAILVFSLLDTLLIAWLGQITIVTRLVTHLPLIPLVGGVSYEFIRLSARNSTTTLGRIVVAPGLWLQNITTKEPDDSQLEVALVALRCALGEDVPQSLPVTYAAAIPAS